MEKSNHIQDISLNEKQRDFTFIQLGRMMDDEAHDMDTVMRALSAPQKMTASTSRPSMNKLKATGLFMLASNEFIKTARKIREEKKLLNQAQCRTLEEKASEKEVLEEHEVETSKHEKILLKDGCVAIFDESITAEHISLTPESIYGLTPVTQKLLQRRRRLEEKIRKVRPEN